MQIVAANRGWIDYSLRLGILQPSGWLNGLSQCKPNYYLTSPNTP